MRGSPRPKHTNKKWRQNNYYPFGLKHEGYNNLPGAGYKYKYNGKEYEDSFGLNIYEMDMRQLDPAIRRWLVQDPVTHHDFSPYSAFDNNPVYWSDPSGADAIGILDKEGNLVGGSFIGQDAIDAFNLLAGFSTAEKFEVAVQAIMMIDTSPGDDGNGGDGGNGNDGGGWQKLDKSTLRNYAQKLCNCSGGMLEQFTSALFENAWHSSYQLIGAIDNFRAFKNKMKGGSRTTVPDGVSDGIIKRWFLSDIVVPNAAWFEVKAMNGTIYNSQVVVKLKVI